MLTFCLGLLTGFSLLLAVGAVRVALAARRRSNLCLEILTRCLTHLSGFQPENSSALRIAVAEVRDFLKAHPEMLQ